MKVHGYFCLLLACVCLFLTCRDKTPVEPGETPLQYTDCPITPGGGIIPVGSDLAVMVPEGAVDQDTVIQVAKLDEDRMQGVFADFGADFPAVAGFDVKPAGMEFLEPVTFVFKSVPQDEPYVPLPHTVDLVEGTHSLDSCITFVDNVTDSLSVSVVRSGGYVVEAHAGWPGGPTAKTADVTGCMEGQIRVESSDRFNECSVQNCRTVESKVKVQFLTCNGQPIQSAIERVNSGGCYATLSLTPAQSAISMNSGTTVSALLKVGCVGIEGQTVVLNVTGPGSLVLSEIVTDAQGRGSFALMAGDTPGTIGITGTADVRFQVREIIINGNTEEYFDITEDDVTALATVIVKDLPTWHVDLEINFDGGTPSWCEGGTWNTIVQYSTHLEFDLKRDTTDLSAHYIEIPGTQNVSMGQGDCPLVTLQSVGYAPSSTTFGIADTMAYNHIVFNFSSLPYQPSIFGIPCPSFASDVINACIWEDEDENIVCLDVEQYIILFCPDWEIDTTTTDTIAQFLDLLNNFNFIFPMDQSTYTVSGPLWFMAFADVLLDGEMKLEDGLLSLLSWGGTYSNAAYTLTVTKKEDVAKLGGDAGPAGSPDAMKSQTWPNPIKRALQMTKKHNLKELIKMKKNKIPLPLPVRR